MKVISLFIFLSRTCAEMYLFWKFWMEWSVRRVSPPVNWLYLLRWVSLQCATLRSRPSVRYDSQIHHQVFFKRNHSHLIRNLFEQKCNKYLVCAHDYFQKNKTTQFLINIKFYSVLFYVHKNLSARIASIQPSLQLSRYDVSIFDTIQNALDIFANLRIKVNA